MAYSTQSDVQTAIGGSVRLREFSDLENTGSIDAAVVARAIAEADGIINSYIGHRFAVPLAVVPATVSTLSARWASRILRMNRYQGQIDPSAVDQEKLDHKWLEGVAEGLYSLGVEPTPPKASIVIDKAAPRAGTALVSRQRTRGMW